MLININMPTTTPKNTNTTVIPRSTPVDFSGFDSDFSAKFSPIKTFETNIRYNVLRLFRGSVIMGRFRRVRDQVVVTERRVY